MNWQNFIFSVAMQAYMLGYAQGTVAGQQEGGVLPEPLKRKIAISREGGDPLLSVTEMTLLTGWSRDTVLKNIPAVRNGGHPMLRYSTFIAYCRDNESKQAGETEQQYIPPEKQDTNAIDAAVQRELSAQMEKVRNWRAA